MGITLLSREYFSLKMKYISDHTTSILQFNVQCLLYSVIELLISLMISVTNTVIARKNRTSRDFTIPSLGVSNIVLFCLSHQILIFIVVGMFWKRKYGFVGLFSWPWVVLLSVITDVLTLLISRRSLEFLPLWWQNGVSVIPLQCPEHSSRWMILLIVVWLLSVLEALCHVIMINTEISIRQIWGQKYVLAGLPSRATASSQICIIFLFPHSVRTVTIQLIMTLVHELCYREDELSRWYFSWAYFTTQHRHNYGWWG